LAAQCDLDGPDVTAITANVAQTECKRESGKRDPGWDRALSSVRRDFVDDLVTAITDLRNATCENRTARRASCTTTQDDAARTSS
jgi:hypothetical protein